MHSTALCKVWQVTGLLCDRLTTHTLTIILLPVYSIYCIIHITNYNPYLISFTFYLESFTFNWYLILMAFYQLPFYFFTYQFINSSTESDVNIHLMKEWDAVDRLSFIRKSNLFDKLKWISSSLSLCLYYYVDAPHGH